MTYAPDYGTPNWVVNSNGNTHADIKRLYMEAHDAAMVLKARLHAIQTEALHGRNYQTVGYGEGSDREDMTDMVLAVKGIEDHLMRGAARAVRQREGL